MKHARKTLSDNYLLSGLVMMIIGAGGIGYIPGKTAVLTIMFAVVLVAGIVTTAAYSRSRKNRNRTGRTNRRPKSISEVPRREKR